MKTFNISKILALIVICSTVNLYSCKKAAVDDVVKPTVTDTDNEPVTVLKSATAPVIRVIAGGNGYGYQDGKARNSKFGSVEGLWVNKDGSLYICDFGNDVIRKITGDTIVSTLALPPDGPNTFDSFRVPRSMAILNDGTFCVIGGSAMYYFKLGGVMSSIGLSWRESVDVIDADADGKRFWFNANSALYNTQNISGPSAFAYDYSNLGSGLITALSTCPNGVKYVASFNKLYKYTINGVAARILPALNLGHVMSMAVSRDGYKIYIVDDGTLKVITNDPSKPKTITTLASIGFSQIALSNSEKYIYFTTFQNQSVSKLTL